MICRRTFEDLKSPMPRFKKVLTRQKMICGFATFVFVFLSFSGLLPLFEWVINSLEYYRSVTIMKFILFYRQYLQNNIFYLNQFTPN